MLGTPNSGSEIADRLKNFGAYRAFFGPAGQQLGTQRDAAIEALFPPVDYPVGIIAGNRSIYPIASRFLPKPHDGRVSVANTRLDGMADHVVVDTSHPWLVRNSQLRSRRRLRSCGMGRLNPHCRHPRRRVIQYSRDVSD